MRLNGQSYDVTDDLINWGDIEVMHSRSGLTGVVRSVSSKFEFGGQTLTLIERAFLQNGIHNDIVLTLYVQNNSWLWNEVFSAKADMLTLVIGDHRATFSCMDDTIAAKLKANRTVKYEYPVSAMDREEMRFGRILMNNREEYTLAPEEVEAVNGSSLDPVSLSILKVKSGWMTLPLYVTEHSVPVPGALEFTDQQQNVYTQEVPGSMGGDIFNIKPVKDYICKACRNVKVRIKMYLRYSGTVIPSVSGAGSVFTLGLYVFGENGRYVSTIGRAAYTSGNLVNTVELRVDTTVSLSEGQRIVAMSSHPFGENGAADTLQLPMYSPDYRYSSVDGVGNFTLKIEWDAMGNPVSFDCIRPVVLLQLLVDSICGFGVATASIDEDNDRVARCRFAAAESIRDFSTAKIYTSFSDFCDFMEAVFGYVCSVDGREVRFMHRCTLFLDDEGSRTKISEARDVELSVDDSLAYSCIEVGGPAKDYGEDNGIYEANFKQVFTTGMAGKGSTLSLDPKYRLDAYGVEFLAERRGENQSDSDSDRDVFAIYTNGSDSELAPDTGVIVRRAAGTWSGYPVYEEITGYFNTAYHPRKCLEANREYLAVFADTLTYASSEGNADLQMGFPLKTDVDLVQYRRITPYVAKFSTSRMDDVEDMGGLIGISYGGHGIQGWIRRVTRRFTREKESQYELVLHSSAIG